MESLADSHAFDGWVAVIARNEARMLARGEIRWRQLKFVLHVRDPESTQAKENPDSDQTHRETRGCRRRWPVCRHTKET